AQKQHVTADLPEEGFQQAAHNPRRGGSPRSHPVHNLRRGGGGVGRGGDPCSRPLMEPSTTQPAHTHPLASSESTLVPPPAHPPMDAHTPANHARDRSK